MTVLLSVLAAVSYGSADFCGGYVAKRVSAWTVALSAQAGGALVTLVVALLTPGRPDGADLAWAVAAGVGNGVGTVFLYRGLSSGRMGVVAPVSGIGAAVVPVFVGTALGERPGLLAWIGIAAALPAIALVARQPPPAGSPVAGVGRTGAVDGLMAGLGFGILFIGLSRVGEHAGLLPLALNQAVGGLVIVAIAVAVRQPWLPREPRAALGILSGVLGATATGLFMVASRGGNLTVAAVVVSLYPAFTVLLAGLVLRERVHRLQAVGLTLCAAAVVLVAAG